MSGLKISIMVAKQYLSKASQTRLVLELISIKLKQLLIIHVSIKLNKNQKEPEGTK